MKKLFTLITFVITLIASAQAPQGFNYQATVRNSAGSLIVNQNVSFKFNIMLNSQTSVPVYSEIHFVPTDDLGQVNLTVGTGTPTSGTFTAINWASGTYFLGIELNTGSGYVAMGTTQLLSVPYALYANSAGSIPGNQTQIYPHVITDQPINITTSSATLSASFNNATLNQLSKRAGFVYSLEQNPILDLASSNSGNSIEVVLSSSVFSVNSTSGVFLPNTLYYLRAFVITENNTIIYGNEVSFTTANVILPSGLNESFSNGISLWNNYSVSGNEVWTYSSTFGNPGACVKISGYTSPNYNINEDWLISPVQNLSTFSSAILTFDTAYNYTGNDLVAYISNNYSGIGSPYAAGVTWTPLTATLSPGGWAWIGSGDINISNYTGAGNTTVYVAFKYTSNSIAGRTWEIDNVKIITN
jgi:hypothetical protein